RSDDVYMPMTPMFHVHAWGVPYVATMIGVKQVYPGRYEANKLVQLYRDEKVTFSHGVPTVLQMILASEQAKTTDLTGWKMLTGGSAPTQGLAQEMCDRGIEFFTAYGMSESCPLISCVHLNDSIKQQPLEQQLPQRICAGTPVGLVDVRIIDSEGKEMPQDGEAVGEVLVRAPWLTQGYYKEPEKSELLWKGGWLHTGDVASINSQGVLVIKDRIKDVIKTGGEWVSSLELENLISQHEEVAQVAVIGVPDEKWDERPYALVVPTAESNVDSEVLKTHLKQYVEQGRINKWAIPKYFKIVSDIPKTSVGKIDKKRIRLEVV
ncbi:MAG: AMP-binding protein, partial [Colwellia sp.]